MDNTKEANKKKKTCCCTISWKRKKREEGIYDPPPLSPVLSDEREESRFWSRFFRSVDEKKTNSLFLSKKGVLSLFFSLFGNFIAPFRSYWVGVLLSLSLSGFLFSCYWRDEERRARSLKGQHTQQRTPRRIIDMAAAIERYALTSFTESSTSYSIESTCVRLFFSTFLFLVPFVRLFHHL